MGGIAWLLFTGANLAAMLLLPSWETIPFHFIWISLTIVYGFRVWGSTATGVVLALVAVTTGGLILSDAYAGEQLWGELFEVPLMSAMFLAMVWHARRRQDALRTIEREADERAALLRQQKRFLHDVSHELRTPVTIARGHLEVLRRTERKAGPGDRGRARRARPDRAHPRAAAAAREVEAARLRRALGTSTWDPFSRMCSCVGPRWSRADGRSARSCRAHSAPIPRLSGSLLTHCSRTRSSTPSRPTRSGSAPARPADSS